MLLIDADLMAGKGLALFMDLAQRAGMVGRALTWHQVLSGLEGPHQAEFADAVPGWLGDFLNAKINITAMR